MNHHVLPFLSVVLRLPDPGEGAPLERRRSRTLPARFRIARSRSRRSASRDSARHAQPVGVWSGAPTPFRRCSPFQACRLRVHRSRWADRGSGDEPRLCARARRLTNGSKVSVRAGLPRAQPVGAASSTRCGADTRRPASRTSRHQRSRDAPLDAFRHQHPLATLQIMQA